jgi:uncharacterized protein
MTTHSTERVGDVGSIVQQVVDAVQPRRVVLFGSRARRDATSGSDFDLMVEMPDGTDRLEVLKQLYLLGIPSVEFVVTTPEIYDRLRSDANYVHYDVARDGRELYAA